MTRTLAISAHHEAAHAVIALDIGRPFAHVSISDGSGPKGRIVYANDGFELFMDYGEVALVTLAGAHGQRRFAPRSQWRFDGRSDRAIVRRQIRKQLGLAGKRAAAKFVELDARAEQAVARHWLDITKIAAALLEKRTLTEDEVRAVLGQPPRIRRKFTPAPARLLVYEW